MKVHNTIKAQLEAKGTLQALQFQLATNQRAHNLDGLRRGLWRNPKTPVEAVLEAHRNVERVFRETAGK